MSQDTMPASGKSSVERRHSSVCIDHRECDGGTECICQPSADAPLPQTYELWWCMYCGESSYEDSDPCQRCGEPIVRRTYVMGEAGA